MNEERERIRCRNCELVQWNEQENCRRCGVALPQPIVKVIERVVERVVVRHDPQCLDNLEQARQLIAAASDRLTHQFIESATPLVLEHPSQSSSFPTMAEMERTMILAAYRKSNRRPVEAARLLGIGKTTLYRKLRELGRTAAWSAPNVDRQAFAVSR
jgi:DNA-binding NtrC family response regulator